MYVPSIFFPPHWWKLPQFDCASCLTNHSRRAVKTLCYLSIRKFWRLFSQIFVFLSFLDAEQTICDFLENNSGKVFKSALYKSIRPFWRKVFFWPELLSLSFSEIEQNLFGFSSKTVCGFVKTVFASRGTFWLKNLVERNHKFCFNFGHWAIGSPPKKVRKGCQISNLRNRKEIFRIFLEKCYNFSSFSHNEQPIVGKILTGMSKIKSTSPWEKFDNLFVKSIFFTDFGQWAKNFWPSRKTNGEALKKPSYMSVVLIEKKLFQEDIYSFLTIWDLEQNFHFPMLN